MKIWSIWPALTVLLNESLMTDSTTQLDNSLTGFTMGSIVFVKEDYNSTDIIINLPKTKGNYLLLIEMKNGQKVTKSIVRL